MNFFVDLAWLSKICVLLMTFTLMIQLSLQLHLGLRSKSSLQLWIWQRKQLQIGSKENRLPADRPRTKSVMFGSTRNRSKRSLDKQVINITLPGSHSCVTLVKSQKLLGVIFDDDMTLDKHVESLGKKLLKRIGLLKRIKNCLAHQESVNFYITMIKSVLMCRSFIWT